MASMIEPTGKYVVTDDNHYTQIANTIRTKTGQANTYTPSQMPSGIEAVYDSGKQAAYDEFWDIFQQNGTRRSYRSSFGLGWNAEIFKPKYDIRVTYGQYMFAQFNFNFVSMSTFHLGEHLKEIGVTLDTSPCINCTNMFWHCYVNSLPPISIQSCVDKALDMFNNCRATKIDNLISSDTGVELDNSTFRLWKHIEDITITGKIYGSINFQYGVNLTLESAKSIINALLDCAGTDKEFTYTLFLPSEVWALLDADGATSPNGNTWREYVTEDLKWNI